MGIWVWGWEPQPGVPGLLFSDQLRGLGAPQGGLWARLVALWVG